MFALIVKGFDNSYMPVSIMTFRKKENYTAEV